MSKDTTVREAIVTEILGELEVLLTRLEGLNNSLPDSTEVSISKIKMATEFSSRNFSALFEREIKSFDTRIKESLARFTRASEAIQNAAMIVDKRSHRFTILATTTGFASGFLGGVLAALALGNFLFK